MKLVVLTENLDREKKLSADQLTECKKVAVMLQRAAVKVGDLFIIKDIHDEKFHLLQTVVTTSYDFWKSHEQMFNRLPYDAEIKEDV